MSIQDKFRRLMGFDLVMQGLVSLHRSYEDQLSDAVSSIRDLIYAESRMPVLACVTVICEGVDCGAPDQNGKVYTTLGADAFVYPGSRVMIPIEPQRMTGHYTFFVSGHPNLVIRQFNIGNDFKMSNSGSAKFGRVHGTCEIGQRINVEVEYRESP